MLLKVGEFVFENFVKFAYFLEASMRNEEEQRYFDEFYEEVYVELERKYGTVDELNVCENIGEHMIGNVYVKFAREEDAEKAVKDLENRWYVKNSIFKLTSYSGSTAKLFIQNSHQSQIFVNLVVDNTISLLVTKADFAISCT